MIVVFSAWHDVIVVIVSAKKFGRKKPPCGGLAGEPVGLGRGTLDHFTLGRFVDRITEGYHVRHNARVKYRV